MQKNYTFECPRCKKIFRSVDKRRKFCSRNCSASYNNSLNSKHSEEHKKNVSLGLKRFWEEKRKNDLEYIKRVKENGLKCGKKSHIGRYKTPSSLKEISSRTSAKILKRLDVGCSRCGWKESSCDIHHIHGKKIKDPDNHNNLCCLCPNCHRLVHTKILKPEELVPLSVQIKDDWKKYYYG